MDLVREARLGGAAVLDLDPPARPRGAGVRGGRRAAAGHGRRRAPRPPSSAAPRAPRATGRCWHEHHVPPLRRRRRRPAAGAALPALADAAHPAPAPGGHRCVSCCCPCSRWSAVLVGQLAPARTPAQLRLLAPTVFAVVLRAGGRSRPPARPAAASSSRATSWSPIPVRDRTVFGSTVLLCPGEPRLDDELPRPARRHSYVADRGPLVALALVTVLVYCLSVTVVGQAFGLVPRGRPPAPRGSRGRRGGAAVLVAVALAIQFTGNLTDCPRPPADQRIALSANFGAQRPATSAVGDTASWCPRRSPRRRLWLWRTSLRMDASGGSATAGSSRRPGRYVVAPPLPATSGP